MPAGTGLVPADAADTTRRRARRASKRPCGIDGQSGGRAASAPRSPGVGDVDGNGGPDLAFGSDFAFRHGRSDAGEVTVALLPGPARPAVARTRPASVAPDTPPPAVAEATPRLRILPRALKINTRGRVAFSVRCDIRCEGTLVLRVKGRTVARERFAAAGATSKTVRLTLPYRLARRSLLRATAVLSVGSVTTTRAVTIRKPSR